MKAEDSQKENIHLLANMTAIRVGTSVVKNAMIKTAAHISAILNQMNADLQCTGGNYESLDYEICADKRHYRDRWF